MATASASGSDNIPDHNDSNSHTFSTFLKTVCLQDWWLIKAEKEFNGKRLAVGGLASREQQAVRVFSSAPITKRYDLFTLETADGITVMIKGSINRSRTHQSGFPSEVCNHFLLGFPYYWEDYADQFFLGKESTTQGIPTSIFGFDELTVPSGNNATQTLPDCLGGTPVTKSHDHLISAHGDSENLMQTKNMYIDVLGKCSRNDLKNPTVPISSATTSSSPPVMLDCLPGKSKSEQKQESSMDVLSATNVGPEGSGNILLLNKRDNLIHGGYNVPESNAVKKNCFEETENVTDVASKDSVLKVNAKVVSPSDVELHTTKEISNENEVGGTGSLLNASKRNSRDCFAKNMRNYNGDTSKDHSVPPVSDVESVSLSKVNTDVPAGNSSTYIMRSSKRLENSSCNRQDKIKTIGSSKSESTNLCSLAPQDNMADMVTCVEEKFSGGNSSTLSNVNVEGILEKSFLTSSNGGHSKFSSNLRNCNDDTMNDDAMKGPSNLLGSDVNNVAPSEVNTVTSVETSSNYLTRSSKRLESLKRSGKDNKQTKSSLTSEGPACLKICSHDTVMDDSLKDASAPLGSDVRNISPSEVNMGVPVDTLINYLTTSSKKLESSKSNRKDSKKTMGSSESKRTNFCSVSVSQDYEAVMGSSVEEKLSHGNSKILSSVGLEGIVEESLSTAPYAGHPKISERVGSCSFNTREDPTVQTDLDMDTLNVTPTKGGVTRTSSRLKNLKGNGEKNPASVSCVNNQNNEPSSKSEVFENPDGKPLTGRSSSNAAVPPSGRMVSFKEIVSPPEPRRSSSRLKKLKNKSKEDQSNNSGLDAERNKVNSGLVGFDFAKNVLDNVECEPRGRSAQDLPNVGIQDTMHELSIKELVNGCPRYGSQMNCLVSSVPTDAIQELNCGSVIASAESREQNESCRSSIRLGDVNHTNDLKSSGEGEEINDNELGTSGKKSKRNLEYIPYVIRPLTRNMRKNSSFVSPEYLSLRRSRSGRLLVPPLDFWRNQQVVYDVDGQIAGVQDGLPVVESPTGNRSEPPRKKKKLM